MNTLLDNLLSESLAISLDLLEIFAESPDFTEKIKIAFGENANIADFQNAWLTGGFSNLPKIEIRSTSEINYGNGAFSLDTNTIYLSQEYLSNNYQNPEIIAEVLLEEIGHFVDSKINIIDTKGDEGAIFSAVVRGKNLSAHKLALLTTENDTATITLDGRIIEIEQQQLSKSFYQFTVIAQTGNLGLIEMGNSPSINDNGIIAFIGKTEENEEIFISQEDTNNLIAITDTLPNINFSDAVQINNNNQVVGQFTFPDPSAGILSVVHIWDANNPGNLPNKIATGGLEYNWPFEPLYDYEVVFGHPTINNNNKVVFSAAEEAGAMGEGYFLASPNPDLSPHPFDEVPSGNILRPMVADNGLIVVRDGDSSNSPIVVFSEHLGGYETVIARPSQGFNELGMSPSISEDGDIVSFYGSLTQAIGESFTDTNTNGIWDANETWIDENNNNIWDGVYPGEGIFVRIKTNDGWILQRVAGIGGNGILEPGETYEDINDNNTFDPSIGEIDVGELFGFASDSRVAVSGNITENYGVAKVSYIALDEFGNSGLYTSDLVISLEPFSYNVSQPYLVTQVGNQISGLGGNISDLEPV